MNHPCQTGPKIGDYGSSTYLYLINYSKWLRFLLWKSFGFLHFLGLHHCHCWCKGCWLLWHPHGTPRSAQLGSFCVNQSASPWPSNRLQRILGCTTQHKQMDFWWLQLIQFGEKMVPFGHAFPPFPSSPGTALSRRSMARAAIFRRPIQPLLPMRRCSSGRVSKCQ